MSMTMPRAVLLSLLTCPGTATLNLPDGRTGILTSIEREDGSGKSFNVNVRVRCPTWAKNDFVVETLYVRVVA